MTKSEKEKSDYTKLTDYIQKLYTTNGYSKDEIDWKLITSQIKNIKKEFKINYQDIYAVLFFIYKYKKDINLFSEEYNGSIMNLVPYYVKEVEDFKKQLEENKKIKSVDDKIVTKKIKYKKNKFVPLDILDDVWYN